MKENSIKELQERLETLHVIQDARLACNADDLDIREEIAEVEEEIKELQDDISVDREDIIKNEQSSIENIKILEELIENANIENMDMNDCFGGEHIEAIEHILSDYKRVLKINEVLLKENEMYKRNSEIMSKENLSTAEQLKVEIKENFRLKNQLENNRKEYQKTYKDVREELKELKKENEELRGKSDINVAYVEYLEKILNEYKKESVSKQKIKEVIKELEENIFRIKKQYSNGGENCNSAYLENLAQIKILKQILKESEE